MPTQLTGAAARLVDPVLSNHATAYRQPGLVGGRLFPRIAVPLRAGQRIAFGREDFILYNSARSPGSRTARINVGYTGEPYALTDHSLEGVLPVEIMQEAQAGPGVALGRRALNVPLRAMALELERDQAVVATTAASYDANHKLSLTTTAQWDSGDAASTPIADIKTGKEAVRKSIGTEPNLLVLPTAVFNALTEHATIVDRFKYTSTSSITAEMLARLLGVAEIVVAGAVQWDGSADDMSDVWGNNAILAHVPASPMGMEDPSYGYTYQLSGYPIVETPYQDRNPKSWIYPVTDARAPVLTSQLAGFLFTTPLANP